MPWMMIRETEARINVYFTASETVRLGDVGGVWSIPCDKAIWSVFVQDDAVICIWNIDSILSPLCSGLSSFRR